MKQRPQVAPPPRRGGGRSLFPILALISLALLALTVMPAIAQQMGDYTPPHTHNWVIAKPGDPPEAWQPDLQSAITIGKPYIRCGEIVNCSATTSRVDRDWCTNATAHDGLDYGCTIVEWRDCDGAVSGQFGHLDGNGQFVVCGPTEVTHYKAPETPGVVTINCKVDDSHTGTAPTADDAAAWSTHPTACTVYEFSIEDTEENWRPAVSDNPQVPVTVALNAHILPLTDHNGASMAREMVFQLWSSEQPGECLNWPPQGQQSPPDLQLIIGEGQLIPINLPLDPRTPEEQQANPTPLPAMATAGSVLEAVVTMSCHDWGAVGRLYGTILGLNGSSAIPVYARMSRGAHVYKYGTDGTDGGGYVRIPRDYDQWDLDTERPDVTNCIWDKWRDPVGRLVSPVLDDDPSPVGNGIAGDGYSAYEEYRGFRVQGVHQDTDPQIKDMFVVPFDEGTGVFPDGIGLQLWLLQSDEVEPLSYLVNFNVAAVFVKNMYAPVIYNADSNIFGWLGLTNHRLDLPRPECAIYEKALSDWAAWESPSDPNKLTQPAEYAQLHADRLAVGRIWTQTHELGHTILENGLPDLGHHLSDLSPDQWFPCVMVSTLWAQWPIYPLQFCVWHKSKWHLR